MKNILIILIALFIIGQVKADKIGNYCYEWDTQFLYTNKSTEKQVGIAHLSATSCPNIVNASNEVNCSAGYYVDIRIEALNFTFDPVWFRPGMILSEQNNISVWPGDALYVYEYPGDNNHITFYTNTSTVRHYRYTTPDVPNTCVHGDLYQGGSFQALMVYIPADSITLWEDQDPYYFGEAGVWALRDTYSMEYVTTTTTTTTIPGEVCNLYTRWDNDVNGSWTEGVFVIVELSPGEIVDTFSDAQGWANFTNLPCSYSRVYAAKVPTYLAQYNIWEGVYCDGTRYFQLSSGEVVKTFDVEFWVDDYGTLDMTKNRVRLYGCDSADQCSENAITCPEYISSGYQYTNESGYYKYSNRQTTKPYVCGRITSAEGSYDDQVDTYALIETEEDFDFNFSLSRSITAGEVCIGFKDVIQGIDPIQNVDIEIWWIDVLYQEGNTGSEYFCFNRSYDVYDEEATFRIQGVKTGYLDAFGLSSILLPMGVTRKYEMTPLDGEVNSTYRYNVTGYVLDRGTDTPMPNKQVVPSSHCGSPVYTDGSGLYIVQSIVGGTKNCCFRVSDAGYETDIPCRDIYANIDNLNITIQEKDVSEYISSINFHIVDYAIGSDVQGASVNIKAPGDPLDTCITNQRGRCDIDNVRYGVSYRVTLSKIGYFGSEFTQTMRDYEYEYTMKALTSSSCSVEGRIMLENSSIISPLANVIVSLFDASGVKVLQRETDNLGQYDFVADCGSQYTVEADYNGIKKTDTFKTPAYEDGVYSVSDLVFSASADAWRDQINDFTGQLRTFLPLTFVLLMLLFVLALKLLAKRLGEN